MSDSIEYLQRLAISHIATRILVSGVQLGIFETIGDEGKTASEIAEATATSVRGTRILLDCLVSFHLLKKSEQRYCLTPLSSRYLRKSSPDYMGHLWEDESILEQWNHLNDAIRTGKPLRKKGTPAQEAASFASLARSLHVVNWKPAQTAAQILVNDLTTDSSPLLNKTEAAPSSSSPLSRGDASNSSPLLRGRPGGGCDSDSDSSPLLRGRSGGGCPEGLHVLDVACGSGVWGIAIAQANPQSCIVAHDFPEILEITKGYVKQHNVEQQFTYLPGDLRTIEFGEAQFDLAILGNIIHSEGDHFSRELLTRVHRSLKESGTIAIIDIIPDEQRTGPQSSLIMALAMLLDTEEGDLFTLSEYTRWLKESGFVRIQTAEICSHSPMIIAHKERSEPV